jgi:hypothetical protein
MTSLKFCGNTENYISNKNNFAAAIIYVHVQLIGFYVSINMKVDTAMNPVNN